MGGLAQDAIRHVIRYLVFVRYDNSAAALLYMLHIIIFYDLQQTALIADFVETGWVQ